MGGPAAPSAVRWRRMPAAALALAVSVAAVLVACGGGGADGPPDIAFGRDVCDECHMIISEPRYASAYRTAGGEARIFDDIGDMLDHGVAGDELDGADAWVHDYGTEAWVDAPEAWFVTVTDLETPMAGEVVAFAEEADAAAFADEHRGEVVGWDDLVASHQTEGASAHGADHNGS